MLQPIWWARFFVKPYALCFRNPAPVERYMLTKISVNDGISEPSTTSWWFQRFNPFEMNIFVKFSSSPQVGEQKLTKRGLKPRTYGPTGDHPLPHLRIHQKKGGRKKLLLWRKAHDLRNAAQLVIFTLTCTLGIRGMFFPSQIL